MRKAESMRSMRGYCENAADFHCWVGSRMRGTKLTPSVHAAMFEESSGHSGSLGRPVLQIFIPTLNRLGNKSLGAV